MAIRFTESEKWSDKWFRKLSKDEKLLFLWLVDNCDNAGFWEIDLELAAFQTGIDLRATQGALEGLNRAYLAAGDYIWVKRFIRVQRNLPLKDKNNAHKQILRLLASHSEFEVDFLDFLNNGRKIEPLPSPSGGAQVSPPVTSRKVTSRNINNNGLADFEVFWEAYPRKEKKDCAWKWWDENKPSADLLGVMLKAIKQQRKLKQWKKDGGEFIPLPHNWLADKRWEDGGIQVGLSEAERSRQIAEKARETQREQYSSWMQSAGEEELIDLAGRLPSLVWLIKELRPDVLLESEATR